MHAVHMHIHGSYTDDMTGLPISQLLSPAPMPTYSPLPIYVYSLLCLPIVYLVSCA